MLFVSAIELIITLASLTFPFSIRWRECLENREGSRSPLGKVQPLILFSLRVVNLWKHVLNCLIERWNEFFEIASSYLLSPIETVLNQTFIAAIVKGFALSFCKCRTKNSHDHSVMAWVACFQSHWFHKTICNGCYNMVSCLFAASWFLDEAFKQERITEILQFSIITDYIEIINQNTIFIQSVIESSCPVKPI